MITRLMRKYAEKKEHQLNYPGLAIMTGAGVGLGALAGADSLSYAKTVADEAISGNTLLRTAQDALLSGKDTSVQAATLQRDMLTDLINKVSPQERKPYQDELSKTMSDLRNAVKEREAAQVERDALNKKIDSLIAAKTALESPTGKLKFIGKPALVGGAIGATIPVGIHLWKKYQGK